MATNTIESVSGQIRHLLTGEFDELNESTIGILLCVPLILLLAVLYVYPIGQAFIFSLNRISLFATGGEFIGFENYLDFLSNPRFYNALTNGVIYTVGSTMLTLLIGVGTALILNRSFFGERFIT